jgi:hypothetical protein
VGRQREIYRRGAEALAINVLGNAKPLKALRKVLVNF